jgi:hypothetical protein
MHSLFDPFPSANRNFGGRGGDHHVHSFDRLLSRIESADIHVFVDSSHLVDKPHAVLSIAAKDVDLLNRANETHGFNGGRGLPTCTDQGHCFGSLPGHVARRYSIRGLHAHLLEIAIMDNRQQIPAVNVVEQVQ